MAPTATATSNQDKLLNVVQEHRDGVALKDAAVAAGITVDQARRAVKPLETENKIRKDGNILYPVNPRRPLRERVEVRARDNQVLEVVRAAGDDGISLKAVAEKLDITERLTYESLWRLRAKEGRVERVGATRQAVWKAV